MKLDTTATDAFSAAQTPEEAAKVIMGAISQGLAKVIAKAIDDGINTTKASLTANDAVQGWETYIGGLSMQMAWQSPTIVKALPLTQTTAIALREVVSPSLGGVSVGGMALDTAQQTPHGTTSTTHVSTQPTTSNIPLSSFLTQRSGSIALPFILTHTPEGHAIAHASAKPRLKDASV